MLFRAGVTLGVYVILYSSPIFFLIFNIQCSSVQISVVRLIVCFKVTSNCVSTLSRLQGTVISSIHLHHRIYCFGILIQQDINITSILHHTQFKTTFICSNTRLQTSYNISRVILDWETLSLIFIPQSDVYKCLSNVHLNLNMKEASSISNKYSYSLTLGFISVMLESCSGCISRISGSV